MSHARAMKYSLYGLEALHERRALISALVKQGRNLSPSDVRQLRRALFEDEAPSHDEVAILFELERAQGAPCADWTEFFVECVTDHVVWQRRPTGIVVGEQAEWLLSEADQCRPATAIALLANVLAEAHCTPEWLIAAVRARIQTPEIQAALAEQA